MKLEIATEKWRYERLNFGVYLKLGKCSVLRFLVFGYEIKFEAILWR